MRVTRTATWCVRGWTAASPVWHAPHCNALSSRRLPSRGVRSLMSAAPPLSEGVPADQREIGQAVALVGMLGPSPAPTSARGPPSAPASALAPTPIVDRCPICTLPVPCPHHDVAAARVPDRGGQQTMVISGTTKSSVRQIPINQRHGTPADSRRQHLHDCRIDCVCWILVVGLLIGVSWGIYLLVRAGTNAEVGSCTIEKPVKCRYDPPTGKGGRKTSRGYLPHAHVRFDGDSCDFVGYNDKIQGREISQADCEAWAETHPVGNVFECHRWEGKCADSWKGLRSGSLVGGIITTVVGCGFLCVGLGVWWCDYGSRSPRTLLCHGGESCTFTCSCGLLDGTSRESSPERP